MKVAMLGPIAWRTPPRALRAVGAGHEPADRGARAPRRRRDPLRDRRLADRRARSSPSRRTVTRRIRRWTAGCGRRCTSRTRSTSPADFDLVHNQLDWLPLAFPGQWGAPMVTTIHGFSGAGNPARLRTRHVGVRVDLGCRPLAGAGLPRDGPPWHRHDRVRGRGRAGRRPGRIRSHPPRQGHRGRDRDRPTCRPAAGDLRNRPGRRVLRRAHRARTSTATGSSIADPSGRTERADAAWHPRPCCCIRSTSTSRSGSRSSRPWRAAPPSSRTGADRCPRSSTTGVTGFVVAELRRSRSAVRRRRGAGPGARSVTRAGALRRRAHGRRLPRGLPVYCSG